MDPFRKNQRGKDVYDIALSFGNDELAMVIEHYLNQQLNFLAREKILFMRLKGQRHIAKLPKGLFNKIVEYL